MSFRCFLSCIVSDKKFILNFNFVSRECVFYSGMPSSVFRFSLFLSLSPLLSLPLPPTHPAPNQASEICSLMSLISPGLLSSMISFAPFSLPSETPITCMFDCLLFSHNFGMYGSLILNCFFLYVF